MTTDYLTRLRSGEISLIDVPRSSKTHAICLAAVNRDGLDLYHVPKYLRSETIIWAAVYQNSNALRFVDTEFLLAHADLVKMAVSRKAEVLRYLQRAYPELVTYDIYLCAVRACGGSLRFVPDELLTEELLKIAAGNDGTALSGLRFVANPNLKNILTSLAPNISLKHLPDHLKTYEICLSQVETQGRLIKYVPPHFLDDRMVDAALKSNPWAIEFVPITHGELSCVTSLLKSGVVPKNLYAHIESGLMCA